MDPGPLHYATYFDRHYLSRGLALHRSLVRHSPAFVLWVLCLDDETSRTLERLRLDHVELVPLADLERDDGGLAAARGTRQLFEYYWTCGPAFLLYLLRHQSQIQLVAYLDADLFFFGDPTPIYAELGDGSILLIEHRRPPSAPNINQNKQKGIYNVGLLVFRRSPASLACLERWREQCIDWCYDRVEPTRFGDQKYLDDWPERYEGVAVLRHRGAGLAPWNVGAYRYRRERGRVLVDGDPLIFYHFNRLRVITQWLYEPTVWLHGHGLEPTVKRHVYGPYIGELRRATRSIRAAGGEVDAVDTLRSHRNIPRLLAGMARHRSFVIVTDRVML
jgi:hypothetical protein